MSDYDDLPIPIGDYHRGVGLFASQSPEQIARAKASIDRVLQTSGIAALARIVRDKSSPGEGRLLAFEKIRAQWASAADARTSRPVGVDLAELEASVAVFQSRGWARILRAWQPIDDEDGEA